MEKQKDIFKTLIFKKPVSSLKYAHPFHGEWGESIEPLLMRKQTTLKKLKSLFEDYSLNWDEVELVDIEINIINHGKQTERRSD